VGLEGVAVELEAFDCGRDPGLPASHDFLAGSDMAELLAFFELIKTREHSLEEQADLRLMPGLDAGEESVRS
jgi:hypothetical protein